MVFPSLSTVVTAFVVCGFLIALLRRPWTAAGIYLYLLCFALLGSFVKQAYLGVALTLADVYFFLLRPIENFHLFINYPLLGMSLIGVCLGFALCLIVGLRFERPMQSMGSSRSGVWVRITTGLAALVLGIGAVFTASEQSRAQVNDGDAYAAFLAMYEMQHVGGVVNRLNVFFNNRSVEAALPTLSEQTRFAVPNLPTTVTTVGDRPDILLVLEESTFDATLIRSCLPADCDNAMLHPLPSAKRTQQGPLLVHTTGGGTWLAEFAIMTGYDWRIFGRGGAYAPVSLAPRMHASLPMHLRALGYRTVAIYPTDGNFLSAQSAYDYYGFDEFYAARDLQLPDDWQATYDRVVFNKALQKAQRADDARPLFVFILTIRNHGPHGDGKVLVAPPFRDAAKRNGVAFADYLARMRDSSTDFTQLATVWLKSERPRVIAWFGDHQPEVAWEFTEHPELLYLDRTARNTSGKQLQYLTQYQLSANFGERTQTVAQDALDIAYLGAQLLSFAGLPQDAATTAAREVADKCNGLLIDCTDRELVNDYLRYRINDLQEIR